MNENSGRKIMDITNEIQNERYEKNMKDKHRE